MSDGGFIELGTFIIYENGSTLMKKNKILCRWMDYEHDGKLGKNYMFVSS